MLQMISDLAQNPALLLTAHGCK